MKYTATKYDTIAHTRYDQRVTLTETFNNLAKAKKWVSRYSHGIIRTGNKTVWSHSLNITTPNPANTTNSNTTMTYNHHHPAVYQPLMETLLAALPEFTDQSWGNDSCARIDASRDDFKTGWVTIWLPNATETDVAAEEFATLNLEIQTEDRQEFVPVETLAEAIKTARELFAQLPVAMTTAEKVEQALESFKEECEHPYFNSEEFLADTRRVYGEETMHALEERLFEEGIWGRNEEHLHDLARQFMARTLLEVNLSLDEFLLEIPMSDARMAEGREILNLFNN